MPLVLPPGYTPPAPATDITSGKLRVKVDPVNKGVWLKADYSIQVLNGYLQTPAKIVFYRQDPDGSIKRVRGGDPYTTYSGKAWAYDHEAPLGVPVRYWAAPDNSDWATGQIDRSGWTALASNSGGTTPASGAIDGVMYTSNDANHWRSGSNLSSGMWFMIAFAVPRAWDSVTLDTGAGFVSGQISGWTLDWSNNGTQWNNISGGTAASAQQVTLTTTPKVSKYLRVRATSGTAAQWTIDEINVSYSGASLWTADTPIVVTVPAPAGGGDDPALLIKSLSNSRTSIAAMARDTSKVSFPGRTDINQILGNRYPSATFAQRSARQPWQIKFLTWDMDQFDQVEALSESKLILVQSSPDQARRDGYFAIKDVSAQRITNISNQPIFEWQFDLIEQDRPPTRNSTLDIPGYSFYEDGQQDGDVTNPTFGYAPTFWDEGAAGPYSNQLLPADAKFDSGSVGNWVGQTNCTVALDTSTYLTAPASLKIFPTTNALAEVRLNPSYLGVGGSGLYSFQLWAYGPNPVTLLVDWYDSGNAFISTSTSSSLTSSAGVWTQLTYNVSAPATAILAVPRIQLTFPGPFLNSLNIDRVVWSPRKRSSIGPYNEFGNTFQWAAI